MAGLLAGCSGLTKSDAPASSIWWLKPLTASSDTVSSNAGDTSTNVLVLVSVVPGLDTANILNLSPNAELSNYSGAHWADELPELLNSLIGRTMESRGGYAVVSRRNSRNLDRCLLRLVVEAFYAELDQAGSTEDVHIAYSGEYLCEGAPVRYLEYDSRTPVMAEKMSSIVASFQSGLNESLERLMHQIQ